MDTSLGMTMEAPSSLSRVISGGRRLLVTVTVLAVALVAIQSLSGTSIAKADSCNYTGGAWACGWERINLAPETRAFFESANNLRNWYWAQVGDPYGGTVGQKCVNTLRGSDGYVQQIACGSGYPQAEVPTYMRPGYMFIVHGANGPRTIWGGAVNPGN